MRAVKPALLGFLLLGFAAQASVVYSLQGSCDYNELFGAASTQFVCPAHVTGEITLPDGYVPGSSYDFESGGVAPQVSIGGIIDTPLIGFWEITLPELSGQPEWFMSSPAAGFQASGGLVEWHSEWDGFATFWHFGLSDVTVSLVPAAAPEPSGLALLAAGLAGLALTRRKRRQP